MLEENPGETVISEPLLENAGNLEARDGSQSKIMLDQAAFDREAKSFDYLMNDIKFSENKKLWLQDLEFETLNKLVSHLRTTPTVFINHHYIRNILKTYFDSPYLKKLTETHRKITVKAIFISAVIRHMILSTVQDFADVSRDSFLEKYPEFETVESKWELLALIRFERALSVALSFLQGKGNKQLLLSVAAHLEGSNMQYVTGGQPSPGTRRRVLMFERLSGVRPAKRAKRDETKKGKSRKAGEGFPGDDDYDSSDENSDEMADEAMGGRVRGFGTHYAGLDMLSRIASEQLEELK